MARIVLDPDDVNQGTHVTLTDGSVVEVATATRAQVGRIARQLARYAAVYADALQGAPLVANNSVWRQFPIL